MKIEEAKQKLVAMIKEWTDANPYMFNIGGEITNPETQRRSTHFNHVIIDEGCTNMGEELHYECLSEQSFPQILEDLDDAISFGEYCHEEGGNIVHHWDCYGFENEAEAWEQFNKEHDTPEGKAELNRLAWLRSIRQRIGELRPLKVGDKVTESRFADDVLPITYIQHDPHTQQPQKVKVILPDGTTSKFLNAGNCVLKEAIE